MRNLLKLQIPLFSVLLIIIPLNVRAQKEFISKSALKNQQENSIQLEKHIFQNKLRNFKKIKITENLLDSVIYKDGYKYNESFTYDDNKRKLVWLRQYCDSQDDVWKNDRRDTYTNDGNGNRLTELWEIWDKNTGICENYWRAIYTCDSSGNRLTELWEYWDRNARIWGISRRETSTYDSSGNVLTLLKEHWNSNTGIWVNRNRTTYTYDGSGNRLTELGENWNSNTEIWGIDYRAIYTYDGSGNRLTLLVERWDSYTGIWVGLIRDTYTYDSSGNMLTFLNEYWDSWDENWKNDYRIAYTYDSSGNKLSELGESWSIYTGKWENSFRGFYTFNSYGNLIYVNFDSWSGIDWFANPGTCNFINNGYFYSYYCYELSAYYSPATIIESPENKILSIYSLSQNFPNPFNPVTTISYSVSRKSNVRLVLYNSLGQKISVLVDKEHLQGHYDVKLDGTDLPSGVYFYRIISDNFVETKKMILIR